MAAEFPGWLTPSEASEQYGVPYNRIRQLVAAGVFTRGCFSIASTRPPIYLRVAELEAFKSGGVLAVGPVKAAFDPPVLSNSHPSEG